MSIEDSQGILTELLEENKVMKEQLRKKITQDEVESLTALSFIELEEGLKITGILLAEGLHNGIHYSGKEIKRMIDNFKNQLSNMELTVEHERTEEYGDKKVGKHLSVEWNPTLKAGIYSAKITDEDAIKDVKEGKFRATSLRLREKKVTIGDFTEAKDLKPINNTLTQFPACSNCSLFHIEDLSLNYYGIIKEEGEIEMNKENKSMLVLIRYNGEESLEQLMEENDVVAIYLDKDFIQKSPCEEMQEEIECPKCHKKFDSYKDFLKHWNEEHKDEYGKYGEKSLELTREIMEELLESIDLAKEGDTKIIKNKKTGKWILMVHTGKKKLAWKIVGSYDSEKEAEKAKEELSAYTEFIGKCMKGGKSMSECAKEWKKGHEEKSEMASKKYRIKKEEDEYCVFEVTPTGEGYGEQKKLKCFKEKEDAENYMKDQMSELTIFGDRETKKVYQMRRLTRGASTWEGRPSPYEVYDITKDEEVKKIKTFETREKALEWIEANLAKEIKCPACDETFDSYSDFLVHWDKEHKDEYGKYGKTEKSMIENEKIKCPTCGEEFENYKEFIEHWNKEHKEEYGKYGKYKEKSELTLEEEEEMRRNRCPYCGELYESLSKHFVHCEVRKNTLSELFKCKYCDKTFNGEAELISHLENCSGFKLRQEELSEKEEEEEVKEPKEEEEKEKEVEEEEPKEKEPEKEEIKEEKIVKEPPVEKKKPTEKELLEHVRKAEGNILDKATTLLLEREKEKW